ncbi:uracil phosphoribosyltransferase [Victivallis sp. Marseille-Q1083]|uniref:uracil phosphoribosyltransferase n=1 Tax=Victivallis sp. Marseille-Q1083 TaxID=2717288 RepID=UPI00158B044B|nr:uracil phosphoribosyltransferase [Victivallis sp. Marseille-Q1083]
MIQVVKHPLVQAKLTRLRSTTTSKTEFRRLVREITGLLVYAATADWETEVTIVQTPLAECRGTRLAGRVCCVTILRAGLAMEEGVQALIPDAETGIIGLYRDPATLEAVEYYRKLPPDIAECQVLLVDPMLATGHTLVKAVTALKQQNVGNLKLITILAAPEGVETLKDHFGDTVEIYTAALDAGLNEHGYILPGLGDAGDRIFGTR